MSSKRHGTNSPEHRRLIDLSHHRSVSAGLTPESAIRSVPEEFDSASRLMVASRPVLKKMSDALDGLVAGGLLADRNGTIVDRYFGDPKMCREADQLGAVVGASFTEERTGTNALSVPLEIRAPIFVRSQEHYLEALRGNTCYGVPIMNPLTRRLEGVIDLMVEGTAPLGLMASLLDQVVDEIAGRLVSDYDSDMALSFAAFRNLCRRSQDGIALLAEDFIVHNAKAAALLADDGGESLRELAPSLTLDRAERVPLPSGVDVTVTATASGADGVILLRLSDGNRDRVPIPRTSDRLRAQETAVDAHLRKVALRPGSVFIYGEQGTGRSRAASLVSGPDAVRLDEAAREDPQLATRQLRQLSSRAASALPRTQATLIVEHVERLRSEVRQVVLDHVRADDALRIVVTANPSFADQPEVAYLANTCCSWIELPPLRQRTSDLPLIVQQVVDQIAADRGLPASSRARVSRATVNHLKRLPWPGNVAELHAVLLATLERRSSGDINVSDLPERYRRLTGGGRTNLTRIEQAERDLIEQALALSNGNKVHAAQHLGISRSKLYDRIRQFGIQLA